MHYDASGSDGYLVCDDGTRYRMEGGVVGLSLEDWEVWFDEEKATRDERRKPLDEERHGVELAEYMITQWQEYLQVCRAMAQR